MYRDKKKRFNGETRAIGLDTRRGVPVQCHLLFSEGGKGNGNYRVYIWRLDRRREKGGRRGKREGGRGRRGWGGEVEPAKNVRRKHEPMEEGKSGMVKRKKRERKL